MSDGRRFRSALTRQLYPLLRGEGFSGSGTTLRRAQGGVTQCFKLESDGRNGWCYLNQGAHFAFLPSTVPLSELEEIHCAFRDRIIPPTGPSRGWVYLEDASEIAESVAFMVSEWRLQGHAFLTRYRTDEASLERLLSEPRPRHLLSDERTYIRIALQLGQHARARAMIDRALESAPERATLLIAELHELRALSEQGR